MPPTDPGQPGTGPQFTSLFQGGSGASGFEQLRQARGQVESILQVVVGDDGVLVQDFSGRIVYANDPAARLLGLADAETLLRTPTAVLLAGLGLRDEAGHDLPGELPGTPVLRGEQPPERMLQLTPANGQPRWLTVRCLPLRDDRGAVATSVTILRDVTEQRRTAEFRESLLGIASHDLRGPLQAISMSAAVLARRPVPLDPQGARLVQQIQSSTEKAARMVHDLLDFTQARLGGGIRIAPREVDVRSLLAAVISEVLAAHPDRTIDLRCDDSGAACWDADRVAQVLGNLLGNAMAYGEPERPVTVTAASAADAVEIAVHNHGPAIDPDQAARMFEPFMRGTTEAGTQRSVGLGLYIVKEIVSAHGGTVGARSAPGAGTTFTVRLPRAAAALRP